MFEKAADLRLNHVPYRGNPPALADLMGGHIPMFFTSTQDLAESHNAGRIRVLATSGAQRSSLLPDVPTFREAGYDIEGTGWYGIYAPAGTSKDVVGQISRIVVAALQTPRIRERLLSFGLVPTGTSPEAFGAVQKRDSALWSIAVKASGFRAEE